jgi:hypothetical protein
MSGPLRKHRGRELIVLPSIIQKLIDCSAFHNFKSSFIVLPSIIQKLMGLFCLPLMFNTICLRHQQFI